MRIYSFILFFAFTSISVHQAYASDIWDSIVETEGEYTIIPELVETNLKTSKKLFDRHAHVTDKSIVILKAQQDGEYRPYRMYLGGRFVGSICTSSEYFGHSA